VLTLKDSYPERTVTVAFQQVQPITASFGPVPAEPVVTRIPANWERVKFEADVPVDYDSSARFWYATYAPNQREVEFHASFAWLAATDFTVPTPDFRAVSGWNTAWEPVPGGPILDWNMLFTGKEPGSLCQAGVRSRTVEWYGSL
jgi:hypothetical protein